MSSEESKSEVKNERHLLIRAQHPIYSSMIEPLRGVKKGGKNVIDPYVVRFFEPIGAGAVTLAFDRLPRAGGSSLNFLDVSVRDVDAPNLTLQIEATVQWSNFNSPETKPPIRATICGEGRIGSLYIPRLGGLVVHLDVYAVDGRPASPASSVTGGLNGPRLRDAVTGKELEPDDGAELGAQRAVLAGLNALRLNNSFTDVDLKVDGKVFRAHRAVLAANSPILSSAFANHGKKSKDDVVEIEGPGPSATAFGLFLEFLYTGSVGDWKGCEWELLGLAGRFEVDHLKAVCERLLGIDGSSLGSSASSSLFLLRDLLEHMTAAQ